jgi:hypothetical protein
LFARHSCALTALASLIGLAAPACGDDAGDEGAGGSAGSLTAGGSAGKSARTGGNAGAAGALAKGGAGSSGGGGSSGAGGSSAGGSSAGVGPGGSAGEAGAGGTGSAGEGGHAGEPGGSEAGGGGAAGSGSTCPAASQRESVELEIPVLTEASGLCASRLSPGIFFTHNDSGESSDVYAFAENGAWVATLTLSGALSEDWEDIGVGPGPESGKSYLYVADIGDNDRIRTTSIKIERALEPALSPSDRAKVLTLPFQSLYFSYPDQPHNAETLLVDPVSGDLYIATKGDPDGARVYVARAPHSTTVITPLEYVTTLGFGRPPLTGSALATGGSVAPDGSALLIRSYDGAFLWRRPAGTSLGDALQGEPCALPVAAEAQGEGVTFDAQGQSFYTLGEGDSPEMSRVVLIR